MNTTENAALDAILAECEQVLELDAKAGEGPWSKDWGRVRDADCCTICVCVDDIWEKEPWLSNAGLIAESRTITPFLARALKLAIPALRAITQTQESVLWIHGRPSPDVIAGTTLRNIIDLWD